MFGTLKVIYRRRTVNIFYSNVYLSYRARAISVQLSAALFSSVAQCFSFLFIIEMLIIILKLHKYKYKNPPFVMSVTVEISNGFVK